jgi:hypothetical protein
MDARALKFCGLTVSLALAGAAVASGCVGGDDAAGGEQADASTIDSSTAPKDGATTTDSATAADGAADTGTDASDGGADAADAADAAPVTVELLTGFTAAANNGSSEPIHTFYQTKKIQWLLLAADLTAAGVPANATVEALELQASQVPGRTIDAFRIGLANTATAVDGVTAFPRAFYGATNVVYGPVDEPTGRWGVGNWTKFTLAAPFVWTGGNVLVETSFTLAADGVTNGGLLERATGRTNDLVRYYTHAAAPAYPFAGTNAINGGDTVPAMRVTYHP